MISHLLVWEFVVSLLLILALFAGVAIVTLRKLRNGLDYLVKKNGNVLGQ